MYRTKSVRWGFREPSQASPDMVGLSGIKLNHNLVTLVAALRCHPMVYDSRYASPLMFGHPKTPFQRLMVSGFQGLDLFCFVLFSQDTSIKIQTFLERGNQALSLYHIHLFIYSTCILDPLLRDPTSCSNF